jgi:hypothetical protein
MLRLEECENCCEKRVAMDEARIEKLLALAGEQKETMKDLLKSLCDFPTNLLQQLQCEHEHTICKMCISNHIVTQLVVNNFTHIVCPDVNCERTLLFEEIKHLLFPETFQS